jgi:hypothetical protein
MFDEGGLDVEIERLLEVGALDDPLIDRGCRR